ncbi:J-domain-containing protein [Microbacterium sp. KHB019]|uniref:DnaJ family domain-containing protein n=1 Tax=Microbacterium sp. KHB019 TaxID=3129770 RepID=UPI003079E08D
MTDPRDAAARYRARQNGDPDAESEAPPTQLNAENKHQFVETAIQLAIRRGEFDDLPGAGKPLENLGSHHDPDWWIRRKIETENLTGLGPPAILLRNEDRELDASLDRLSREGDVREVLEDFNRRVIDARRQLMGGPPVVTKTRDVDAEIDAWRRRRAARAVAPRDAAPAPESPGRRGLFRRRG